MASEFVIKNGYFSQGNSNITGSLTVTGGVTASLQGTASFSLTASYAMNGGGTTVDTGSFVTTSSFDAYTGSAASQFAGTASFAITSSYYAETDPVFVSVSGSFVTTSSFNAFTSSYTTGSFTGSFIGDGSGLTGVISSSYAVSSSYASTASYVLPLLQDVIITGSLLLTGSHISTVDYIDFTVLPVAPGFNTGRLHWIDDTKTLQLDTDVNNFELEIGHQSVIRGRNVNSFTITKGTVVYINGESGNRPTFATASWEGDPSSATTIGIIAQDINNNQTGYAVTNGLIRGVDTTLFSPGTSLYLSSSGQYSSNPAISPLHEVRLGKTITQAVDGIIYIDIQNGYEIGELHDVLITSAATGDLITWDSGSGVWKNTKQLTGSYGLTGSLSATSFTGSLQGTASYSSNSQLLDGSDKAVFATTGSNVFKASQIITGSLTITNDLVVLGSSSIQYITSSQLDITTNIISVNTYNPSVRFGGLAVIDSGSSPIQSGSLLFDSQNNQWIYVHQAAAGADITSSVLIMGPQTFNNIGNETTITANRLTKGTGGDLGEHIGDSNITDDGNLVTINSNTEITGSVAISHSAGIVNIGPGPTATVTVYTTNTTQSGRFITDSSTVNATGILASSVGTNSNTNIGIQGTAINSTTLNIGVLGFCTAPTAGTNIGSYFWAVSGSSNYAIQLRDGTETVAGRFLINQTTDGKANWGNSIPDIQITNAVTGSTGNNISTDAMIQASLLYLSNNC